MSLGEEMNINKIKALFKYCKLVNTKIEIDEDQYARY